MVDKICEWLLKKIKLTDEAIDDEKAEVIYYGLQNIVGELPKGIFLLALAAICGVFYLVLIGTTVLLIYRAFAGGVHLKTHITCFLISTILVIGSAFLAKQVRFVDTSLIYFFIMSVNLILAILYAPSDTENRPIMKESQMTRQKIESMTMVITVYILSAAVIKNQVITNLFMYMITIESFMITPIAYKIFDNKTGEERRKQIQSSM